MTKQIESVAQGIRIGKLDHTQGPQTAPVTLVEYGDYGCSSCGEAHTFVQETRQRLGDHLCFVFRHFVQADRHPWAQHGAEAAEAAGAQGRFWEMHNTLLTHQGELDNGHIVEYAVILGLDIPRFLRDMAGHVHAGRVSGDHESGTLNGVSSIPTFFINGVRHNGPWDEETLLAAVDDADSQDPS